MTGLVQTNASFHESRTPTGGTVALRWAARALVVIVWISAAIFGFYIVAFYFGAVTDGKPDEWNKALPHLYDSRTLLATVGMGMHFAAGTVLLLAGPIQLIRTVRERVPRLHRWIGRTYALLALATGVGGLVFIGIQGTIGGIPMALGFALYGTLIIIAAVETVRHARARRYDRHRAWAIRLFALVIGSWLYRMDYGFWTVAHGTGHTHTFNGPFDHVMDYFFYLPNLVIAEAFIRARDLRLREITKRATAVLLGVAALFLMVSTYFFTVRHWGPGILRGFHVASVYASTSSS